MSNEVNKVNEVSYWGAVVVTEVVLFFVNEVKMRFLLSESSLFCRAKICVDTFGSYTGFFHHEMVHYTSHCHEQRCFSFAHFA